VIVVAIVTGAKGKVALRLALDTGSTGTLVDPALLASVGYDPAGSLDRRQVTTGSGVESAPRVRVDRLASLGVERYDFPVVAHTLPSGTGVDGLLGLDFLRGERLILDFRNGFLRLE
jgi:predicted aspartyl protease